MNDNAMKFKIQLLDKDGGILIDEEISLYEVAQKFLRIAWLIQKDAPELTHREIRESITGEGVNK